MILCPKSRFAMSGFQSSILINCWTRELTRMYLSGQRLHFRDLRSTGKRKLRFPIDINKPRLVNASPLSSAAESRIWWSFSRCLNASSRWAKCFGLAGGGGQSPQWNSSSQCADRRWPSCSSKILISNVYEMVRLSNRSDFEWPLKTEQFS